MPSRSKKLCETTPVSTRSGSPRLIRSKFIWWYSTRPSNTSSPARDSRSTPRWRRPSAAWPDSGARLTHDGQPIAVLVRQRLQQHAVDDAEDRGVGADAETERQHGQHRIARVLQQRARAIPHILDQLVEPDHAGVSFMPWPLWSEVVTWMCQELTESLTSHYYFRGAGEDSAVNGRPHRCGLFF